MDYIAPAIVTVVVATLVFIYLVVRMAMRYEERKLAAKLAAKSGAGERVEQILAETQTEVARLRERVQVLERLVTDEDRRVASEISRLGDSARVSG